jgi:hypothetical protein
MLEGWLDNKLWRADPGELTTDQRQTLGQSVQALILSMPAKSGMPLELAKMWAPWFNYRG